MITEAKESCMRIVTTRRVLQLMRMMPARQGPVKVAYWTTYTNSETQSITIFHIFAIVCEMCWKFFSFQLVFFFRCRWFTSQSIPTPVMHSVWKSRCDTRRRFAKSSLPLLKNSGVSERVGIDCSCFSLGDHHFSTRTCAEKMLWLRAISNVKATQSKPLRFCQDSCSLNKSMISENISCKESPSIIHP